MKKISLILGLGIALFSCNENTEVEESTAAAEVIEVNYASFGEEISAEGAISAEEMYTKYLELNENDTIEVKFTGVIEQVCQKKGCWMYVELNDEESAYVRFKDYGFFMPFNASDSEAIMDGIAFVSKRSVEELRHDAEDANKSQEEIDAITEPEVTYRFEARGVLIKE